jgi:putative transposase
VGQPVQVFAYTGETYLLTCMRYIELNPVRPTMVEDPANYRGTSYRANAPGQTSPRFSFPWHATDKARQAAYRHLFRYHLDEEMVSELRLSVNQNKPSGTSVSMRRLSAWLGSVARRHREGGRA